MLRQRLIKNSPYYASYAIHEINKFFSSLIRDSREMERIYIIKFRGTIFKKFIFIHYLKKRTFPYSIDVTICIKYL